jgi:hypothetical protein
MKIKELVEESKKKSGSEINSLSKKISEEMIMFFKKNSKINKKSVNTAFQSTFIFWGVTLLINALFENTQGKPLVSDSFVILFSGLVIFYSTELIANYFNNKKK